MKVEGLDLPKELLALVSSGWWPKDESEALAQNVDRLVPIDCLKAAFPDEHAIYFFPPPFGEFIRVLGIEI